MRDDLKSFFLAPKTSKQRQYEALRAYVIDEIPAGQVAQHFGFTEKSLYALAHDLRKGGLDIFPKRTTGPKDRRAVQRGLSKKNSTLPPPSRNIDFDELEPFHAECQVAGIFFFLPYIIESGINALSSPIMVRIHFDILLSVVGSFLYYRLAQDLPRFEKSLAPDIFRRFVDMPGRVRFDGYNFKLPASAGPNLPEASQEVYLYHLNYL